MKTAANTLTCHEVGFIHRQEEKSNNLDSESTQTNETFSVRLNELLDANPNIPSVNAGRYQELATYYGVGRQQTHRWCTGKAVPPPHLLKRLATDLKTSVDWLLGGNKSTAATTGIAIPAFRLNDPNVESLFSNFLNIGDVLFPAASPVAGRQYAFVQNWSEAADPDFAVGDDLLVDLSVQALADGDVYLIRNATSTSVRRASIDDGKRAVRFYRSTGLSQLSSTYPLDEVVFNERQRFDVEWRKTGVLVLGRIEAVLHGLVRPSASFIG